MDVSSVDAARVQRMENERQCNTSTHIVLLGHISGSYNTTSDEFLSLWQLRSVQTPQVPWTYKRPSLGKEDRLPLVWLIVLIIGIMALVTAVGIFAIRITQNLLEQKD